MALLVLDMVLLVWVTVLLVRVTVPCLILQRLRLRTKLNRRRRMNSDKMNRGRDRMAPHTVRLV
jgi:hypothetical protein